MTSDRSPTVHLSALQDRLRPFAVWRAQEPAVPEAGVWRVERFVAVVEDEILFRALQQEAVNIEERYTTLGELLDPRRRLPAFFDEAWSHCAVHVNRAYESRRVQTHAFALDGWATPGDWPELQARLEVQWRETIVQLQALGLRQVEVRGVRQDIGPLTQIHPVLSLEARRGRRFTVRRASGHAYRLHASTIDGQTRKNVRARVIVVRGLAHAVVEHHPHRKIRKDALKGGVVVGPYEVVVPG